MTDTKEAVLEAAMNLAYEYCKYGKEYEDAVEKLVKACLQEVDAKDIYDPGTLKALRHYDPSA